jgi:L-ornithine Nalpha-acyltransferase
MLHQPKASEGSGSQPGVHGGTRRPDRAAVQASSGTFAVRLAESEDEVRAAQALRYRIFYGEKKATPTAAMRRVARDFDCFDDAADHLLVLDTTERDARAAVVGTYRLIRRTQARATGFYSAGEFDLSKLETWPGEVLELGRSCVDAGHRSGRAINLLWRGIAAYLSEYGTEILFGCGSLPGTDPESLALPLSYMHHYHLAPGHIRPRALPGRYVSMNMMPRDAINPEPALATIPPLIKGYLRLGGFVGDGAVVDDEFNCTDVCIVVQASLITSRYARHYGCEVTSLNAA